MKNLLVLDFTKQEITLFFKIFGLIIFTFSNKKIILEFLFPNGDSLLISLKNVLFTALNEILDAYCLIFR